MVTYGIFNCIAAFTITHTFPASVKFHLPIDGFGVGGAGVVLVIGANVVVSGGAVVVVVVEVVGVCVVGASVVEVEVLVVDGSIVDEGASVVDEVVGTSVVVVAFVVLTTGRIPGRPVDCDDTAILTK